MSAVLLWLAERKGEIMMMVRKTNLTKMLGELANRGCEQI